MYIRLVSDLIKNELSLNEKHICFIVLRHLINLENTKDDLVSSKNKIKINFI